MGGKASAASKNKWNNKTYDRITITVKKKDNTKELIQQHAAAHGESVTAFITRAITETIARDNTK